MKTKKCLNTQVKTLYQHIEFVYSGVAYKIQYNDDVVWVSLMNNFKQMPLFSGGAFFFENGFDYYVVHIFKGKHS